MYGMRVLRSKLPLTRRHPDPAPANYRLAGNTTPEKRPFRRIRVDVMADADLLHRSRPRLRFGRKVAAALVDEAVDSLAQAKAMHDELEALYNPYVDFPRVHTMANAISAELLAREI